MLHTLLYTRLILQYRCNSIFLEVYLVLVEVQKLPNEDNQVTFITAQQLCRVVSIGATKQKNKDVTVLLLLDFHILYICTQCKRDNSKLICTAASSENGILCARRQIINRIQAMIPQTPNKHPVMN